MIEIRHTAPKDALQLKAMLYRSWHDTYAPFLGAARVDHLTQMWHTLEKLERETEQATDASFVALNGDEIIGHALVSGGGEQQLHLKRLYVDMAHHGRGVGHRLLSAALGAFPDGKTVTLEVYENNVRAVRFYLRHGFEVSEKLRDEHTADEELYEFRMTKPL